MNSIALLFIGGSLCYIASAFISNYVPFQNSSYYYITGLSISLIANSIWLTIAKSTENAHTRYLYGLYWDSMIVIAFAFIPVLLWNSRLSFNVIIGVFFILLGIFITKV